jgi:integrase
MNPNPGEGEKALLLSTGEGVGLKNIPKDVRGELISFAWYLKKQGRSDKTIEDYTSILRLLVERGANLKDSESVKEALARNKVSEAWKQIAIAAYSAFLKFKGLKWDKPVVRKTRKIPFIPMEKEIDELIAGCGSKTSCLLQLLKETGMRIGEALRLKWSDIDFERRVIILNEPEKHGNPRIFKISDGLIGRLNSLPRRGVCVFDTNRDSIISSFYISRKRLARNLNNPRLLRITFHTLRHWKATMEYHKTKDIIHVKELLGHRDINNTLLYVQVEKSLFNDESDEFIVKTAREPEEIKRLLEVGFEYVCNKDGLMFFRKRK